MPAAECCGWHCLLAVPQPRVWQVFGKSRRMAALPADTTVHCPFPTRHHYTLLAQALEGHLRGILGTMTVEEIYREREQFADQVMKTAAPEFESMGMEIVSFVIQDVTDEVGYLESLGKTAIADMKKEADIGTATATRDVKVKVSLVSSCPVLCATNRVFFALYLQSVVHLRADQNKSPRF